MKHKIGYNTLGISPSHRRSLLNNLATSLFRYERIRTTKAKAKELRSFAEKLITRAKEDSVHNRRRVARRILDKAIIAKLFTEIGPRFSSRPGGYTRILNIGQRQGDAAPMVIIELVAGGEATEKAEAKPKRAPRRQSEKPAESQTAVSESRGAVATEEQVSADAAPAEEAEESTASE